MTKNLETRIRSYSMFDITDMFGKSRIRRLMFEYNDLVNRYKEEKAHLNEIIKSQAEAVTKMVCKTSKLEDEVEYLKGYIQESDAAKCNLQQNKMSANRRIQELSEENDRLKENMAHIKEDYKDLNSRYETLLRKFNEEHIEAEFDDMAS